LSSEGRTDSRVR